jgi:uncharacterized membrane protein
VESAADRATDGTSEVAQSGGLTRRQALALGALVIGYAALSHYSDTAPGARGLAAGLTVGPVLLIGFVLVAHWAGRWIALTAAALSLSLLYWYWPVVEDNYEWADLIQQCGIYALIAASFARSLWGERRPLCTELAAKIHGELTPVEIAYTRRATAVWSGFYAVLTVLILTLFFAAPRHVWSLFVNFGTFALIILAGIGDHALRRRVLPRHPGGGLLGIIRRSLIG